MTIETLGDLLRKHKAMCERIESPQTQRSNAMFPARKMHTFAIYMALQILRNADVDLGPLNPDDINLNVVESKLHQHWLADNKVAYIKELRSMCETPGKTLDIPFSLCSSVSAALSQVRDSVERREFSQLGLLEAKHIAYIVWANAERE